MLPEDHAIPIDPFAAERIEVIRGPATLRYGSGAIGSVVALENDRIPNAIPPRGISGELLGGLTSVDEGREGAVSATAGANGIAVHVDGFKRDAADYDTPNGRQFNSFVEAEGLSGGGSYIWKDGYIGLAYSSYRSLYGIPGEEAAEERPRIDLKQDKLHAMGEWRLANHGIEAMRFWFGVSDYESEIVVDENEVGQRFTNEEIEARFEVEHMPVLVSLGRRRRADRPSRNERAGPRR